MSATLTQNNEFYVHVNVKSNHSNIVINYLNYDHSTWAARLNGNNFVHAPNGDWSKAHEDSRIDYIQNDGSACSATINGEYFHIINHSKHDQSSFSRSIYFNTWENSPWTAELKNPTFMYWRGTIDVTTDVSPSIRYIAGDGAAWTATILADGSFKRTSANGQSHNDVIINYLTYERKSWYATLNLKEKTFRHASKKAPFQAPPAQRPVPLRHDGEFQGIFVKEENGFLYYRPVDNSICSNNLAWVPLKKIVGRYKSVTCYNLGQWRDIYLFYYVNN